MDEIASGSDLRLGLLLLLNAAVGISAWGFAKRVSRGRDWVDVGADAFVAFYLVQYVVVCGLGAVGMLSPAAIGVGAIIACTALWAIAWKFPAASSKVPVESKRTLVAGLCLGFLVGYLAGLVGYYRHLPVLSQDALTYHFPAAASWLRTGRIEVFETWFFNPANTYSPLGGSAFIAWLLAPMGNDTVASFVQMPALVGLWFVAVRLARVVGLPLGQAAVTALIVVGAQPFIRASVLSKDDLFVAMFFTAALAGLGREYATDRIGPWRVGLAAGLMLAMKYTALLAVPVLLLAIDGAVKAGWGWRKWLIACACAAAVSSPWYLRNRICYGNPLFPVEMAGLPGLMSTQVSQTLRSWEGVWRVMTGVDDALPGIVLIAAILGWLICVGTTWHTLKSNAVMRAIAAGPLIGLGLFLWKAPYAEVRFLYPVIVLLLIGFAAGVYALLSGKGLWVLGGMLALAVGTGLPPTHTMWIAPWGIAVAALAGMGCWLGPRIRGTHGVLAGVVATLTLAGTIFVYWPAYVRHSAEMAVDIWGTRVGPDLAAAWGVVRALPAEEKVAYANTYLVYPLMGFDPKRELTYVPTRGGVTRLSDLPNLGQVSGDEMVRRVAEVTNTAPSEGEWLDRITNSGAKYLFVEKRSGLPTPPEIELARKHPDHFKVLFENNAAVVYQALGPRL